MEIIDSLIRTISNNFDFTYCVIVNILTYLIIVVFNKALHINMNMVQKRIILVAAIILIGAIYYETGLDKRTLLNSAILCPVSWSWIIKPILSKLGYDYKQIDNILN